MKEITRMGGGDGPKVGTAAGFDFLGDEIIFVAANREIMEKFCSLAKIALNGNVYEVMLAEMEHVEVVSGPGVNVGLQAGSC